MIRINLLGIERQKARKAPAFDFTQRVPVLCALIVVLAAGGVGWWFWTLRSASAQLDGDITALKQEQTRLQVMLAEVQRFEDRRAQLQQRVALIEQLRSGQSIPVQVLDHVSRSLPDALWLTTMSQDGDTLMLEGRSTTLIALSDFVGNLGGSALLKKPIEIVTSQVEGGGRNQPQTEVIRFAVRAQVTPPPDRPAPAAKTDAKKKGAGRAKAARS